MRQIIIAALLSTTTACGGLRPAPGACDSAAPGWEAVCEQLDTSRLRELSVIIGDETGERLVYSRGDGPETVYRIASASKLLTSVTIMRLVDRGVMSLDDHPQRFISWWPTDAADPRSAVTLRQLLAFTAGYEGEALDAGCVRDEDITLDACARQMADQYFTYTPGTTFHYAPGHMHLAALMAERATDKKWNAIFREEIGDPLEMSAAARYDNEDNPDPAGGARASGSDYAAFMLALARGELLTPASQAALLSDQSGVARIAHSPVSAYGWTWRYGLGCWKECYEERWGAACDASTVYSSAGAFGFYPWIDAATGRWGVVALQRSLLARPARDSVQLILDARGLIDAAHEADRAR
jgi:CubicO group peptidase (beta-lactamase class C family)